MPEPQKLFFILQNTYLINMTFTKKNFCRAWALATRNEFIEHVFKVSTVFLIVINVCILTGCYYLVSSSSVFQCLSKWWAIISCCRLCTFVQEKMHRNTLSIMETFIANTPENIQNIFPFELSVCCLNDSHFESYKKNRHE